MLVIGDGIYEGLEGGEHAEFVGLRGDLGKVVLEHELFVEVMVRMMGLVVLFGRTKSLVGGSKECNRGVGIVQDMGDCLGKVDQLEQDLEPVISLQKLVDSLVGGLGVIRRGMRAAGRRNRRFGRMVMITIQIYVLL